MLFKRWFLNALRDVDVRSAIKQLTAEAVVSVKVQVPDNTKIVELERQLATKDRNLERVRYEHRESVHQKEVVQEQLRDVQGELKKFKILSGMISTYGKYQKLNAATKKAISGIINGRDLLSFICSGVQETNLDRFWDICNESYIDGDADASKVSELFSAFFDLSQTLGTINSMERLTISVGERFDNDLCTRIARSAPTGPVATVLLQGYRYSVSKKVIKKSLVRV